MTERERLIEEMAAEIAASENERNSMQDQRFSGPISHREAAMACLAVLERPASQSEQHYVICTCGQNGYPENSPHANHPHLEGCPHYVPSL